MLQMPYPYNDTWGRASEGAVSGDGDGTIPSTTAGGMCVAEDDVDAQQPISLGTAAAGGSAVDAGEVFVTPSEPFFVGQLDGIEALSSKGILNGW